MSSSKTIAAVIADDAVEGSTYAGDPVNEYFKDIVTPDTLGSVKLSAWPRVQHMLSDITIRPIRLQLRAKELVRYLNGEPYMVTLAGCGEFILKECYRYPKQALRAVRVAVEKEMLQVLRGHDSLLVHLKAILHPELNSWGWASGTLPS